MEAGNDGLKRELMLWDLVPMQNTVVVWLGWTGFRREARTFTPGSQASGVLLDFEIAGHWRK
jgi:hypothetical protein